MFLCCRASTAFQCTRGSSSAAVEGDAGARLDIGFVGEFRPLEPPARRLHDRQTDFPMPPNALRAAKESPFEGKTYCSRQLIELERLS